MWHKTTQKRKARRANRQFNNCKNRINLKETASAKSFQHLNSVKRPKSTQDFSIVRLWKKHSFSWCERDQSLESRLILPPILSSTFLNKIASSPVIFSPRTSWGNGRKAPLIGSNFTGISWAPTNSWTRWLGSTDDVYPKAAKASTRICLSELLMTHFRSSFSLLSAILSTSEDLLYYLCPRTTMQDNHCFVVVPAILSKSEV